MHRGRVKELRDHLVGEVLEVHRVVVRRPALQQAFVGSGDGSFSTRTYCSTQSSTVRGGDGKRRHDAHWSRLFGFGPERRELQRARAMLIFGPTDVALQPEVHADRGCELQVASMTVPPRVASPDRSSTAGRAGPYRVLDRPSSEGVERIKRLPFLLRSGGQRV